VEVEPLPQATNQSRTIVCGGGQMCIEVVKVPKILLNKSGQGAKIIPEIENEKSNVQTKVQTSSTTTIDNKGSSWGTSLTSKDTIILKVSDPVNNKLSHSTITNTNNSYKILDKNVIQWNRMTKVQHKS